MKSEPNPNQTPSGSFDPEVQRTILNQEQFEYHCSLCGNVEILDNEISDWKCICQKQPHGLSTLHICSTCQNRWWASLRNTECPNCLTDKLNKHAKNLNQIHVNYETFGQGWKNMRKIDPVKEEKRRIENEIKYQEALEKKKQLEKQKEHAILQTPILLRELIEKLDEFIMTERGTGFNVQ